MNIRVQTRKSTKRVTNTQTEVMFQESYKGECVFICERRNTGPEVYCSRRLYNAWTQVLKGQRSWDLRSGHWGRATGCRFPQWLVIDPAFTLEKKTKRELKKHNTKDFVIKWAKPEVNITIIHPIKSQKDFYIHVCF